MVRASIDFDGPCAIRYPKKAVVRDTNRQAPSFVLGKWNTLQEGKHGAILAVGSMIGIALDAANTMRGEGIDLEVINASTIKPLDTDVIARLAKAKTPIYTLEEHVLDGGFGSEVLEYSAVHALGLSIHPIAITSQFVTHGDHKTLLKQTGLDTASVAQVIRTTMQPAGTTHDR